MWESHPHPTSSLFTQQRRSPLERPIVQNHLKWPSELKKHLTSSLDLLCWMTIYLRETAREKVRLEEFLTGTRSFTLPQMEILQGRSPRKPSQLSPTMLSRVFALPTHFNSSLARHGLPHPRWQRQWPPLGLILALTISTITWMQIPATWSSSCSSSQP